MARQAQAGDTVHIHYTGTLRDGSVFDSSEMREPLSFTLGSGQVIAGFDDGVTGMAVGEKKRIVIPAADAYGEVRDELRFAVPRNQIPPQLDLRVGQQLQMGQQNGDSMVVTVAELADDHVVLDANHPLAGKELTFELELVSIE